MRQTFDELVIHTPHVTTRMELPWTLLDLRLPHALRAPVRAGRRLLRDGEDQRSDRNDRAHGSRRPDRAPGGRLPGMATGSRVVRLPAARRPAVARPGGASRRSLGRSRDLDRPQLRSRRLCLELSGQGRDQGGRRVIRAAGPREGIDRAPGAGPGARRRALPGQLDPPPAPSRHGGRHLLRWGLGGPLPAPHRRGNPDRLLLRHRLRSRASQGDRRAGDPARSARALRSVLRPPPVALHLAPSDPAPHPQGSATAAGGRRFGG